MHIIGNDKNCIVDSRLMVDWKQYDGSQLNRWPIRCKQAI